MSYGCVCGGVIMSNGLCACGIAQTPRHEHVEAYTSTGQKVCATCAKVLVDPIMNADDPRLLEAKPRERQANWGTSTWETTYGVDGYNNWTDNSGGGSDANVDDGWVLPILLVDLFDKNMAPPAEYVEIITAAHRPANLDEWIDMFCELNLAVEKGV